MTRPPSVRLTLLLVLAAGMLSALAPPGAVAQDPDAGEAQTQPQPAAGLSPRVRALLDALHIDYTPDPPELRGGAMIGAFLGNAGNLQRLGAKAGEAGVKINQMNSGSPLEVAGAKPGDIILAFNGETYSADGPDPNARIREQLRELKGGTTVKATLFRPAADDGEPQRLDVEVTLATRAEAMLAAADHPDFARDDPSALQQLLQQGDGAAYARLRETLQSMNRISYSDEGVAHIPDNPIPFRLREVTYCLRHPFDSPAVARKLADELAAATPEGDGPIIDPRAIGIPALAALDLPMPHADRMNDRAQGLWQALIDNSDTPMEAMASAMKSWKGTLTHVVQNLTGTDERQFLFSATPRLYSEEGEHTDDTDVPDLRPSERKRLQMLLDARTRRTVLHRATWALQMMSPEMIRSLLEHCRQLPAIQLPEELREQFTGEFRYYAETDAGRIIVGGPGPNVYKGEAAIILDLGGNDRYENHCAASTLEHPVSICIDFGGNDRYEVDDHLPAQGSGRFGLGLLMDLGKGKDGYKAKTNSQGCGVLGIGLLIDDGGDDVYISEECSQGAGVFGVGILHDADGTDRYTASHFSQAFAGVGGYGAILETGGSDTYTSGGKIADGRDPTISTIALSQGFSFGLRPYGDNPVGMSGGIAILLDTDGHDVYLTDYFGQGSSYYYGLGILVDERGRDTYRCGRYSQGAGTHYTIGVLIDEQGDDTYDSYLGVSQGCGHDWSLGALIDHGGDDRYRAGWLSQGAGNAVGIGLLMDAGGRDEYVGQRDVQGWGTWGGGRGVGSFGVLYDRGDEPDRYNADGRADGVRRLLGQDGERFRWGYFADESAESD